jgi:hypothetical protein
MLTDFETTLGLPSQAIELEANAQHYASARRCLYQAGFLTVWEAQSQAATAVLIGLVAFAPLAVTLSVMFTWALIAALVYNYARLRGLPDVFDSSLVRPPAGPRRWSAWTVAASVAIMKVWLAGVQPFLYARAFSSLLAGSVQQDWRKGVGRGVVLTLGLVLFGVTAAHHLLRRANLSDHVVLRLCCVGSFLNVTYRVTFSALIIGALTRLQAALM